MKRNWFFLILFVSLSIIFVKREVYLPMPIVSNPDSWILFTTQDDELEQTWQPSVKAIKTVQMPYYAENSFNSDIQFKIYSDDYSQVLVEMVKPNCTFVAGESGVVEFDFDRTTVTLGERYRLHISFINATTDGSIRIASGTNYGGCSISGKDVEQAAALNIIFAKYSKLFWITAVLFPILSYSLLSMVITRASWEETVALSFFAEGIVLYFFGVMNQLLLGLNIVYALAIICLLIAIYIFNKKNLNLKELLSPGLFIYLLFFCIIIITSNGDWLGKRDDLRHWGIAVQDMFCYDSLANHVNTTVILPRYLPFTALIEYVFVYMNGMFGEDILLISYQTIVLSVLLIMYKPLQKKDGMKLVIPSIITMICVPIIFFNDISSSIMVDSLQAVIVAYILICYYTEDVTWFNRIRITSAMIALTLVKDVGLVLAGMTALIIFGDMIARQIKEKKVCIKELCYPIACVVIVLAMYFSWQNYLSIPPKQISESEIQEAALYGETTLEGETTVTTTAISASGITIDSLIAILKGNGEPYQQQVTRNFIIELFDGETYSFGPIMFSFVDLLFMNVFLIVTLGYFGYWKDKKYRMYTFALLIILASLCLCAFMLVMYWFVFSLYQALGLTSFGRYLAPYLCAVIIVIMRLIFEQLQYKGDPRKEKYMVYTLSLLLFISVPVAGIVVESKDREGYATEENTYGYGEIAEILRSVAKRGERAYFICTNSEGYSEYLFRNAICPIVSEHENWNIVLSEEVFSEKYELYDAKGIDETTPQYLPVVEWKKELEKCKYVVVFHANELFKQSYGEVFEEPNQIEDGSIYQVHHSGEDILLRRIGKTGIKSWQ